MSPNVRQTTVLDSVPSGPAPAPPRAVRGLLAIGWLGTAVFVVHALIAGPAADFDLFRNWLYNGLIVLAAGLCFWRARHDPGMRGPCIAFGLALSAWAAGFIVYPLVVAGRDPLPYPSVSDACWLLFYPPVYVALGLLLRQEVRRLPGTFWLHGVIAILGLAALNTSLLLEPLVAATGGRPAAVATSLAYPLGDLFLLGMALAVVAISGLRSDRRLALICAAFVLEVATDTIYLLQSAGGTYAAGGVLDGAWPAVALLMAHAVWQPTDRRRRVHADPSRTVLIPIVFSAVAVVLLIVADFTTGGHVGTVLATLTLVAALADTALTVRATGRLRRLALRDALTGLGNHGAFHDALEREIGLASRDGTALSLVLFDLDGFKQINDAHGHAEGDRVLRETALVLRETCRGADVAGRLGGDEFGVLLVGGDAGAARAVAERVRSRVATLRPDLDVSYGVAEWPTDGPTKDLLLLRADMALYEMKPAQRDRRHLESAALVAGADQWAGGGVTHDAHRGPAAFVAEALRAAREELGMEVAYLAELTPTEQVYRELSGDVSSFGLHIGQALPLDQTYCKRMVDGDLPSVIPDTAADERVSRLAVTANAALGSYVGVPVRFDDGRLYGTLCCLSHAPQPSLRQRDAGFLRVLARLMADRLQRAALENENRRLALQTIGLDALLAALNARDFYTGHHSETVVELSSRVGSELGLSDAQLLEVEQVARMHDIGKLGIPDAILHKQGPLDETEWELMRQHPAIGERIVASLDSLSHLAPAIRAEHERWDGGGYPDGLAGERIPLASRITFACDAYDAMTTDRPYRQALTIDEARRELERNAGSQFDPAVVEILLRMTERSRTHPSGRWETAHPASGSSSPRQAARA
jgi:diguanylate cyclase (GGDEF)-like protein